MRNRTLCFCVPLRHASRMKRFLKHVWSIGKKVFWVFFIAQFFYIVLLRWVDPPFTLTQIVDSHRGYPNKQKQVSLDQMSPAIKLAVIVSEDHQFPNHFGFNITRIKQVISKNTKTGKSEGASTISQQVAKNVFLWQGGGWFRKGLEAYFTVMIEIFWSKQRILEVYLNVAETGEGIYGVEAASETYFSKSANELSVTEAAMIAACLPNPKLYTVKPPSSYVINRCPSIIRKMKKRLTSKDIQQVIF